MSGAVFRGLDLDLKPMPRRKSGLLYGPAGQSDEQMPLRGLVAGISAAAIILLFVILSFSVPRFEVHRSDQTQGMISMSVPEATARAFLAMASAEACADVHGIGRANGIDPAARPLEGVSYMTLHAWREECGGMVLSIPLRGATERAAARRTVDAFQAAVGAVVQGREQTAVDAAAAFHDVARRYGVGYRLVGYSLR